MESKAVDAADLPIDIQYRKLLDWLVDRKRVPREWHNDVRQLRLRIETGLGPLVEGCGPAIHEFLSGRYVDYYSAKRLLEIALEERAELSEKDLLGRYTHPSVKIWTDIIKGFENKNLYLAEGAQLLLNNTDVEASLLRKNITRLKDTLADLNRREGEAVRSAAEARGKYAESCTLYGLDGSDDSDQPIESLLNHFAAREAPKLLQKVAEAAVVENVEKALGYYDGFLEQVTKLAEQRCRSLRAVRELEMDQVAPQWAAEASQSSKDTQPVVPVLDWDMTVEDTDKDVDAGSVDVGSGVVWDIEIAEESAMPPQIDWDAALELDTGPEAAPNAIGGSAISYDAGNHGDVQVSAHLDNDMFRSMFLDDVYELVAFLEQRRRELRNRRAILVLLEAQALPSELRREPDEIASMIADVEEVGNILSCSSGRRVIDLKTSTRQLQRLARELSQEKFAAEKLTASINEMNVKRKKLQEELEIASVRLKAISCQTLELKKSLEGSLSSIYEGRTVNIMGEVNLL